MLSMMLAAATKSAGDDLIADLICNRGWNVFGNAFFSVAKVQYREHSRVCIGGPFKPILFVRPWLF